MDSKTTMLFSVVFLVCATLPHGLTAEDTPTVPNPFLTGGGVASSPVASETPFAQSPSVQPNSPTEQPVMEDTNLSTPSGLNVTDSLNVNCTDNSTDCAKSGNDGYVTKVFHLMHENKEMLMRSFYVLIGVTLIIVVYFAIRTIRWRSRNSRMKRYGLLTTNDRMEMQPLDQDDDDDDMTVFDINHK